MNSDDSRLETLINQCKNNDVDVKVDALSKLQAEFESGIEINDPDGLIQVLKTCLRTSNQHLTTATLSVLPPLLPQLIAPPMGNTQSQNALSQSTSSISSVAPSSVVDTATLRQVVVAFLPPGGLIERLGDKERAQLKARESLVILGGLAFRSGAPSSSTMSTKSRDTKGPETPLMMFERYLREIGLASKVWKVREQSILTLVHVRRAHQQFPIRAYLPQLVDALEDTDAHVRDCARQSVIELFSGPGVSDAARADLKKEMTKKNVRKTIVDGVLSKLLGIGGSMSGSNPQSREGSENGDTTIKPKEYVPPSLALSGRRPTAGSTGALSRTASVQSNVSRPPSRAAPLDSPSGAATPPAASESTDIRPVYVASSRDLETEFAAMQKPFEGKENEHNWADRERAILRVRGMLKGEVHLRYTDSFLGSMKEFIQLSLKTLASLRTTVAVNTCSLYTEMAVTLGPALDPFCDTLFTNLLRMAGFTKKLTAQQSQASLSALIEHTSTPPRILLPLLWQTLQEKTVQARAFGVAHLKQYLEVHGQRSKHAIDTSGGGEIMEKSLKKALADPNPAVRDTARICFWVFEGIWRDRGVTLLGGLDSVARKQLEKACPNPELAAAVLPPTTPKPAKKSSVAAAIAASRAKAKAIATAPPTLRHQATASSHAVPVRRAGSPNFSPRNSVARPSSPLRMSTSPPSQKTQSRIVSNGVPRSASAEAVTTSTASQPRNASGSPPSPPSPSDQMAFRRRTSSPLAPGGASPSTIRKALKTTLPSSPSSSFDRASQVPRNGVARNAVPVRHSTLFAHPRTDDESLLLAQTVPIPGSDTDSESMDHSVHLMSFSAAFEKYASPVGRRSHSPGHSFSPEASNALSSGSLETTTGQPVVEDALRARAEQAESAAERLLELVDPDDESMQHSTIPSSLIIGTNANGVKAKAKPTLLPIGIQTKPPVTPVNRAAAIMRQAAQFKNSPAYNGHSSASLMDVLQDQRHQTGWWLKRKNLVAQGTPLKAVDDGDRIEELQSYVSMLEKDDVDVRILQKLALLSIENPITESVSSPLSPEFGYPASPSPFTNPSRSLPSLHSDMWGKNKNFERLFNGLLSFLQPDKTEEEIEYGLIVLWELIENQAIHIEGREGDVFSLLLRIRYCCHHNVLEATNTIRDALTTRIEPVYGLTTMHASLRSFSAEAYPPIASEEAKAASYAFGLIALGKFILRLPAEIAEEELPRLRGTLISALNDKSSLVIRESAAAAIISAQLALRDETHLFALLDGLADEKKNLLTYLFDKHGARGVAASTGPSGIDKLEKEMRRLDTRTSTPRPPPT
ncbi:clasp N terminal-domain-containing protein [Mycena alexandri]|uniref:Clasp N terminal-domain-containing protein n=1 Tax=Mycena alexandri TaxID=1745969 RepID=A0AAD6TJ65_9AGAR|nr:clasp N terminal-domain-containing protein [Mycena alexandri]